MSEKLPVEGLEALSKAAGCCAFDRDEATVTLAFSDEGAVMEAVRVLPPASRIRICDDGEDDVLLDALSDQDLLLVTCLIPGGTRGGLYGDRAERIKSMRAIIDTIRKVKADPVAAHQEVQRLIAAGTRV